MTSGSGETLANAWGVLTLFLIPIGGGIPAGVLLAKTRGIAWPITALLYLISDMILACIFEPVMLFLIARGKNSPRLARAGQAFKQATEKATAHYGTNLGPLALIMVSFGVDPMTGRTIALARGHGFFSGWMIAIAGDMLYFALIMISTLWLSEYLGDGTTTMWIILGVMFVAPMVIRKIRGRGNPA